MAKAKKSAGGGDLVQVGVGCVTINPPLGVELVGYPKPRANTGIDLDLCARAMAFASPGAKAAEAALVVVDNIGTPANVVARIRARAAELAPAPPPAAILVAATHTHSAPLLRTWKKAGRPVIVADDRYVDQLVEGAASAVAQASQALRPARMRFGRTEAHLGHNRRVLDETGKAHAEWLDPEGKHTGYFNPQVPFLVFDDAATDKPHAMIVSYWCHPVTLGPPNFKASPDYPGYWVRELEKATGAAMALHVTGGGANINPRQALYDNSQHTRTMAHELAEKVLAALGGARPLPAGKVRSASAGLKLKLAPTAGENDCARAEDSEGGKVLTTEVQALAIGDLAFVTAPGELFAEIGAAMQEASPFAQTIVVGYADDYLGYLFTDRARAEGGYEPGNPISEEIEKPLLAAAKEALRKAKAAAR
jgi:hypothetical protein